MPAERRGLRDTALRLGGAAIATLMTAGCGPGTTPHDPATPTPLASPIATPVSVAKSSPTPRTAPSLTRYAGHYPFDKVGGVAFLDATAVVAAVKAVVPDAAVRRSVLSGDGPGTPITMRGGKLIAWGCETHDCSDHDWSILIARDGGGVQVCYHDAATMQERSRWYSAPAKATLRGGDCPSS